MKSTDTRKSIWKQVYWYRYIYLLLLPGLIYFTVFAYGPMYGIQLAFKNYSAKLGIWGSQWVGLSKFVLIINNPQFLTAFKNTVIISVMKIIFTFPIPILLAILINELTNRKLSRVLQTVFTFPHFLSWIILSGILLNLLRNDGAVNNLIEMFGGQRVAFMTNPGGFRWLLVITDVWKESGWSMIIYLAAIAGIDTAMYESATLDGANRLQKALYITWPGMRGLAGILLVLAIGNMMNANFDQIFNLSNAMVQSTSDVIDTYVYRISFQQKPDFGFSTAVGLFKGVINFALLLSANMLVRRFNEEAIF